MHAANMQSISIASQSSGPQWLVCRTKYGMPDMSYRESIRQASAVIFNSHFATIPAVPMSPHAHVLGSLTAQPAEALPEDLATLCSKHPDGIVYMSYGTSAIPGNDKSASAQAGVLVYCPSTFGIRTTVHPAGCSILSLLCAACRCQADERHQPGHPAAQHACDLEADPTRSRRAESAQCDGL